MAPHLNPEKPGSAWSYVTTNRKTVAIFVVSGSVALCEGCCLPTCSGLLFAGSIHLERSDTSTPGFFCKDPALSAPAEGEGVEFTVQLVGAVLAGVVVSFSHIR